MGVKNIAGLEHVAPRSAGGAIDTGWYVLGGLPVQSNVPLPLPRLYPSDGTVPSWVIRYGAGQPRPMPGIPEEVLDSLWRGPAGSDRDQEGLLAGQYPDGLWFWYRAGHSFRIAPDARLIEVFPAPGADVRFIGQTLCGPIAGVVLNVLGHATLHGSAVVTPHGAVGFLGPSGQGKSTMAASFVRRGAALLADDMLVLETHQNTVYGRPSESFIKLWEPGATHALGPAHGGRSIPRTDDKKVVWLDGAYALAREPAPLRALYVLDRQATSAKATVDVTSLTLAGRERIAAILIHVAQSSYLATPAMARLLPTLTRLVSQAAVRVLRYPDGEEMQERVYAHVLAELVGS
ncbi:MAG: hypothetical protein QOF51_814 [Chloroflexota bacterium]|nr:hypothetical protein [Chloroflexota bacterium]